MAIFLFIIGVSISLAMSKMVEQKTEPKLSIFKKIAIRSIKLFILGLFLENDNNFPFVDLSHLRILGTLQRISFDYFLVATTMLFAPTFNLGRIDNWCAENTPFKRIVR
jgi:predicted acyltransferase